MVSSFLGSGALFRSVRGIEGGFFQVGLERCGHEPCLFRRRLLGAASALLVGACLVQEATAASLTDMRAIVAAASQPSVSWQGPTSGPPAQADKTVAMICEDLGNGGILGVARGVEEAAAALGWSLKVFDAGGTPPGRLKAIANALAVAPDGVVLIGADAGKLEDSLASFAQRKIPVVGWHVGPRVGRLTGGPVAMNVSTDPLEVARVTAMAMAVGAQEKGAGVVIFTDSNFDIALAKSNLMAEVLRGCGACELLEICDVAISSSAERMPTLTRELLKRYGSRWTHALAINDIYFDYAAPELTKAGLPGDRVTLLSAGDGSAAAFMRIRARSFQSGTVAEPLNLHGWQLLDELNRLFAGLTVSGYIVPVHLVTSANISFDGGLLFQYDPDNHYREIYRSIWRR